MTARSLSQALDSICDPMWLLEQAGSDPLLDASRESRFAISNGFLGVRGGRSIRPPATGATTPQTYIAGLFDIPGHEPAIPALVPGPDWGRISISTATECADVMVDDPAYHRRRLDFRRGGLVTEGRLSFPAGLELRVRVMRLVSRSQPEIGLQLVHVVVEAGSGDVTLEASFAGLEFGLGAEVLEQDQGIWRTRSSGKSLAITAAASLYYDGKIVTAQALGPFRWAWAWPARPGQSICFERMVAVTREDTPPGPPGATARDKLRSARASGWRGVLEAHEAAWEERWRDSDVAIEGDPGAQQAMRFALYHLNSAADPTDDRVSIAARALTGPDYRGHVFWDTEIFLLPFYTWTWPEAARTLLIYRHRALDAARAKAARMGWRGAFYPWESADTGDETTPEHAIGPDRRVVDVLCGTQEQHISADVAYAVWHYWRVTGDDDFLRDAGAEILLETARFWASRAVLEADGLRHIRGVIGPDEYHQFIDDNAFTNVMARWNIHRAIETAAWLRREWPGAWEALSTRIALDDVELTDWARAAAAIATGLNSNSGVFEQFTGFFDLEPIDLAGYVGRSVPMDVVLGRERTEKVQVVKQADVVALLALLPGEFPAGAAAVNFDIYEPRCSHGSSLSASMHGLAAARLGRTDAALAFFRRTAAIDLADTHAAIDGGVHIAALGGMWMMAVLGFAGLTMTDDGVTLDPKLPEAWLGLAFNVQWRSRRLSVSIDADTRTVRVELRSGEPMRVKIGVVEYPLRADGPITSSFA